MDKKYNLAVVIGVADYEYEAKLAACQNDAAVIKDVLDRLQKFDDVCYLNGAPKGSEVKQKITEFINLYKGKEVSELVFYYSGHGARFDDDFFYMLSDFKYEKREVTGLRNSELDGLLRNLSPDLTVKIVDACYAGSMYIKSDGDIKPVLEKSAKENNLKKVYFLHSSSETETSFAGSNFSFFTYSFLESLTEHIGKVRYRDIMAYVADSMEAQSLPKPVFVVQADNTEVFGEIEVELIDFTKGALAIKGAGELPLAQNEDSTEQENDLLKLVRHKSGSEFCTKAEADENLAKLRQILDLNRWHQEIVELFDVEANDNENPSQIANGASIGGWLSKNASENFFAIPRYDVEEYFEEEYKELPKKPNAVRSGRSSFDAFRSFLGRDDEKEYKLEKVKKTRRFIDGFQYTAESPFRALRMYFKPKFSALENYCVTVVAVFSRRNVVVFYSVEHLALSDWVTVAKPRSKEWKSRTALLKSKEDVDALISAVIFDASTFILGDVKARLAK